MRRRWRMAGVWVATCGALCLLAPASAPAVSFDSVVVFGDSLSDSGRAYDKTFGNVPPSPPYDQRFSNGPVAVEHLADALGVKLEAHTASNPSGTNYAVGGATTGTGNYLAERPNNQVPILANTGITAQLGEFGSTTFDPTTTLFVVWGGANDLFLALESGWNLNATVGTAVGNLANAVGTLAGLGAQYILVPNLPDLGATPFGLATSNPGGLTGLSTAFNYYLEGALGQVQSAFPTADIIGFDTFAVLREITASPGDFGFANATSAYIYSGSSADPNTYLFWDTVHPTAAGHAILGERFAQAVPEPATLSLLVLGLVPLAWAGRRRRALW